jgi:hypothetical protein
MVGQAIESFHPLAFPLIGSFRTYIRQLFFIPFLYEEGGDEFLSKDRRRGKRWRTSASPRPISGDIYMTSYIL